MEKQLTCTICSHQYKQTNVPRLLPKCGHSFCENCIKASMEPEGENIRIVCPEDGEEMLFDDEDINNFPKNIALIKLLSKKKDESFKETSLNESNIAKHSINEADEEDKELITAINESTKGTDTNHCTDNNRSDDLDLNLEDMCLIHQKPLEIVCIRDKTKICSTCAIFGDHKGHEFKSLDEVAKDKQSRCDGILTLIDQKQSLETRVSGKQTKDELTKTLSSKKDALSKQIKDRFAKITEIIKSTEKKALDKVTKSFVVLEQRLKDDLKIPETTTKKYIKWQQRAYHQIESFDGENNFLQQLKLLNYDKASDQLDIVDEGEKIVSEIEKCIDNLDDYKKEAVNSITVEFCLEVEKRLGELVIVKEAKKGAPVSIAVTTPVIRESIAGGKFKDIYDQVAPSRRVSAQVPQHSVQHYTQKKQQPEVNHRLPHHNPDDDLLDAQGVEDQEQEEPMVREVIQELPIPTLFLVVPQVSKPTSMGNMLTPPSHQFNSPPDTSRKMASGSTGLKDSSFAFEKAPVKKRPKLKLSEKYDKILDGIINDQLETVDFTNAELGDQVMVQIIECIKGRKVKTLKLIRNKLTDEGLDKMLPYFGNIITLNLSQNLLTDRFVDHLITMLPKLPNLKSLILSQNKIKERSVKTRLEEIKKYEIVVSL